MLVGSIGLVLSVPATTGLAALILTHTTELPKTTATATTTSTPPATQPHCPTKRGPTRPAARVHDARKGGPTRPPARPHNAANGAPTRTHTGPTPTGPGSDRAHAPSTRVDDWVRPERFIRTCVASGEAVHRVVRNLRLASAGGDDLQLRVRKPVEELGWGPSSLIDSAVLRPGANASTSAGVAQNRSTRASTTLRRCRWS
jgi:hypothetical protein